MLKEEFEKLVGYEVSDSEYRVIECCYMAAGDDVDKKQFCEEWKKRFKDSEMFLKIADTLTDDRSKAMKESREAKEQAEKMAHKLAKRGLRWNDDTESLEECEKYESIKTVEDALLALGTPDEEVKDYFKPFENLGADVVAYMKLRVIVEAINEGWKPKFVEGESRYYPWFWLYKDKAAALKDGYDERDIYELPAVVGSAHYGDNLGVSVLDSYYFASFTNTLCGGALALRDRDRAIYCGKQFIAEWTAYNVTR